MCATVQKKDEEYYDTNDPFIDDSELALRRQSRRGFMSLRRKFRL
jgi:hypothetical protein